MHTPLSGQEGRKEGRKEKKKNHLNDAVELLHHHLCLDLLSKEGLKSEKQLVDNKRLADHGSVRVC